MRIDPNLVVVPITKDAREPKTLTTTAASQSAVVTLSGAATSASATPVDVGAKLDRIRALLASGNYPVDLDKLASRIVDDDVARTPPQSAAPARS